MLGEFAACKYASVHLRMQGLHPAVEDFRESGDLAYAYGLHSAVLQKFTCASGGDDFPSQADEALHEIDKTALVADAD